MDRFRSWAVVVVAFGVVLAGAVTAASGDPVVVTGSARMATTVDDSCGTARTRGGTPGLVDVVVNAAARAACTLDGSSFADLDRTGASGVDLDVPARRPGSAAARPMDAAKPGTRAAPQPPVAAPVDGVWERLARCESSGNWAIDTGNGYYGGLQFDVTTWNGFGGREFAPRADQATRDQQIAVATRVRNARGSYGSWPACAAKLGLPR
jgi:Transglycosylase-like domain